jgi:hypothetical protein
MRFEGGDVRHDEDEVELARDEALRGFGGGDQVIREPFKSWLEESVILRTISKVVRHRICSRAPERQAMCDAVGDATE